MATPGEPVTGPQLDALLIAFAQAVAKIKPQHLSMNEHLNSMHQVLTLRTRQETLESPDSVRVQELQRELRDKDEEIRSLRMAFEGATDVWTSTVHTVQLERAMALSAAHPLEQDILRHMFMACRHMHEHFASSQPHMIELTLSAYRVIEAYCQEAYVTGPGSRSLRRALQTSSRAVGLLYRFLALAQERGLDCREVIQALLELYSKTICKITDFDKIPQESPEGLTTEGRVAQLRLLSGWTESCVTQLDATISIQREVYEAYTALLINGICIPFSETTPGTGNVAFAERPTIAVDSTSRLPGSFCLLQVLKIALGVGPVFLAGLPADQSYPTSLCMAKLRIQKTFLSAMYGEDNVTMNSVINVAPLREVPLIESTTRQRILQTDQDRSTPIELLLEELWVLMGWDFIAR